MGLILQLDLYGEKLGMIGAIEKTRAAQNFFKGSCRIPIRSAEASTGLAIRPVRMFIVAALLLLLAVAVALSPVTFRQLWALQDCFKPRHQNPYDICRILRT